MSQIDKTELINDLIILFLNKKINKETIYKLVQIYDIKPSLFNSLLLEKIKFMTRYPTLTTRSYMNCLLRDSNTKPVDDLIKDDIKENLIRCNNISYYLYKRMLNRKELAFKISQYNSKGIVHTDDDVVEYVNKIVETYLKDFFDECSGDLSPSNIVNVSKKGNLKFNLL